MIHANFDTGESSEPHYYEFGYTGAFGQFGQSQSSDPFPSSRSQRRQTPAASAPRAFEPQPTSRNAHVPIRIYHNGMPETTKMVLFQQGLSFAYLISLAEMALQPQAEYGRVFTSDGVELLVIDTGCDTSDSWTFTHSFTLCFAPSHEEFIPLNQAPSRGHQAPPPPAPPAVVAFRTSAFCGPEKQNIVKKAFCMPTDSSFEDFLEMANSKFESSNGKTEFCRVFLCSEEEKTEIDDFETLKYFATKNTNFTFFLTQRNENFVHQKKSVSVQTVHSVTLRTKPPLPSQPLNSQSVFGSGVNLSEDPQTQTSNQRPFFPFLPTTGKPSEAIQEHTQQVVLLSQQSSGGGLEKGSTKEERIDLLSSLHDIIQHTEGLKIDTPKISLSTTTPGKFLTNHILSESPSNEKMNMILDVGGGQAALGFSPNGLPVHPELQFNQKPIPPKVLTHKVAVVIGNSNYDSQPLTTPKNDASGMQAALSAIGFEVTHLSDASKEEMESAVEKTCELVRQEDSCVVFYFSGHGFELQGENYLVPIGTGIMKDNASIRNRCLSCQYVLQMISEREPALCLFILDACRVNGIRSFEKAVISRSGGLAQLVCPRDCVIAFACAPGEIAYEGRGDFSVYTKHLIQAITQPHQSVETIFTKVKQGVMHECQLLSEQGENAEGILRQQNPFVNLSLSRPFQLFSDPLSEECDHDVGFIISDDIVVHPSPLTLMSNCSAVFEVSFQVEVKPPVTFIVQEFVEEKHQTGSEKAKVGAHMFDRGRIKSIHPSFLRITDENELKKPIRFTVNAAHRMGSARICIEISTRSNRFPLFLDVDIETAGKLLTPVYPMRGGQPRAMSTQG